jgi:acetyltransferase-like isoleucine patch superfamily enzyme
MMHTLVNTVKFALVSEILGGVEVGEFCQIGANTTILPKVKIGNNVIVGAGAVVLADIPSNSKAVGIPAKLIFH